jgi:hypothetical protein
LKCLEADYDFIQETALAVQVEKICLVHESLHQEHKDSFGTGPSGENRTVEAYHYTMANLKIPKQVDTAHGQR